MDVYIIFSKNLSFCKSRRDHGQQCFINYLQPGRSLKEVSFQLPKNAMPGINVQPLHIWSPQELPEMPAAPLKQHPVSMPKKLMEMSSGVGKYSGVTQILVAH